MKPEYICDVNFSNFYLESTDIMGVIIGKAINKLLYYFEDRYNSINEVDMTNNCYAISCFVKEICSEMNIKCKLIKICPGYDENAKLFGKQGYHYFNILSLNNKQYIIDLSYKQFFKKNTNFLEEIGVLNLCSCSPGSFMLMDDERKKVAQEILKNGFVELIGDNFKLYCDGFTISYRNGLYYKYFGLTYNTNYTITDYENFLIEQSDNQVNHEPLECLGPLKKY